MEFDDAAQPDRSQVDDARGGGGRFTTGYRTGGMTPCDAFTGSV